MHPLLPRSLTLAFVGSLAAMASHAIELAKYPQVFVAPQGGGSGAGTHHRRQAGARARERHQ